MSTEEDYFAIVWAGNKLFYICSSEEMVEERLQLVINEPEVMVLRPTRLFAHGEEIALTSEDEGRCPHGGFTTGMGACPGCRED